jgi:IS1 family transposase
MFRTTLVHKQEQLYRLYIAYTKCDVQLINVARCIQRKIQKKLVNKKYKIESTNLRNFSDLDRVKRRTEETIQDAQQTIALFEQTLILY